MIKQTIKNKNKLAAIFISGILLLVVALGFMLGGGAVAAKADTADDYWWDYSGVFPTANYSTSTTNFALGTTLTGVISQQVNYLDTLYKDGKLEKYYICLTFPDGTRKLVDTKNSAPLKWADIKDGDRYVFDASEYCTMYGVYKIYIVSSYETTAGKGVVVKSQINSFVYSFCDIDGLFVNNSPFMIYNFLSLSESDTAGFVKVARPEMGIDAFDTFSIALILPNGTQKTMLGLSFSDYFNTVNAGFWEFNLSKFLTFGGTYQVFIMFEGSSDGFIFAMPSDILSYSFVVELPPDPVKTGYDFIGWYYDEAFTLPYQGEAITAETTFTLNLRLCSIQSLTTLTAAHLQPHGLLTI